MGPPLLPFTSGVIPNAVTAEVAIGFVVFQVRFTAQLLAPEAIVHDGAEEESVPYMKVTETEQFPVIAPVVKVLPEREPPQLEDVEET